MLVGFDRNTYKIRSEQLSNYLLLMGLGEPREGKVLSIYYRLVPAVYFVPKNKDHSQYFV